LLLRVRVDTARVERLVDVVAARFVGKLAREALLLDADALDLLDAADLLLACFEAAWAKFAGPIARARAAVATAARAKLHSVRNLGMTIGRAAKEDGTGV